MLGLPLTHFYHLSALLQISVEPSVDQPLSGQEPGTGYTGTGWQLEAHHLYNQIVMMSVEQITCGKLWLVYPDCIHLHKHVILWYTCHSLIYMSFSDMMQGGNGNIKEVLGITSFTDYLAIYMIYCCVVVFCLYSKMVLHNIPIWCRFIILLNKSCSKLVISITEHLVEVVDKLSTTTVVFFRSERELEYMCLYGA